MRNNCSLCEIEGKRKFNVLRVHTSKRDNGKTLITFPGISANTWFTPVGITRRSEDIPYKQISDELKIGIEKRAKSASSILGRRHFEVNSQNISHNEYLRGTAIFRTDGCTSDDKLTNNTKQGRYCGASIEMTYRDYKCKILSNRPKTSYGREKGAYTSNSTSEVREKRTDVTRETLRKKSQEFLNIGSGKNLNANRVKSAPPTLQKDGDMIREFPEVKSRPKTPIYWRTRSNYKKRQIAEQNESASMEQDTIFIPRGSLLKPMLFSNTMFLKHSAGCPYKCKGCFKACLASSDYFKRLKEQKLIALERIKETKTKMYHRRIVERALAESQPINALIRQNKAS